MRFELERFDLIFVDSWNISDEAETSALAERTREMMHSRRLVPALALLAVLVAIALSACSFDNRLVSGHVHDAIAMPSDGSLTVSEAHGTIRVETWNRPLVSVDATEYASDETALQQIRIDAKRTSEGAVISTTYAGSGLFTRSGDVDFVIHAPANANLNVSTNAGLIVVSGSRASVKARTSAGEIDVDMAAVGGAQQIELWATTGEIALRIPRSSSATVDAWAMVGSSTNDFHASRIGTGAATIAMHVITGEVELTTARDPSDRRASNDRKSSS